MAEESDRIVTGIEQLNSKIYRFLFPHVRNQLYENFALVSDLFFLSRDSIEKRLRKILFTAATY